MTRRVGWGRIVPLALVLAAAAGTRESAGQGGAERLERVEGSGLLAGVKAPPGFLVILIGHWDLLVTSVGSGSSLL